MSHNSRMPQRYTGLFIVLLVFSAALISSVNLVYAEGGGAGTPAASPSLAVIGQSCVAGGNYVNVTFQVQGVCPVWDYDLTIDGANYGGIDGCGSPKTVTLNHNTHYGAYAYSWSMGSSPTTYFYSAYCPAPPSVTLYRYNDGSGWNPYDTWMSWNSYLYMHWPATNASYCTRSWAGGTVSPGGVDYSVPPPGYGGGYYYTVSCYGPGGSASDSVWVGRYAPPAPSVTLYQYTSNGGWYSYDTWMPWNSYLYMHWSTANVDYCTTNWVGGSYGPNGVDYAVPPPAYGSGSYYYVYCYGPGGSTYDYVWVGRNNLPPPPTTTISAGPASILVGQSSTITYSSGGTVTGCVLQEQAPGGSYTQIHSNSGGSSPVSRTLSTAGTWNYRAYCSGPGGSSAWSYASVAVNYPQPAANIQVRRTGESTWLDSLTINPGEQIEVGWNQSSAANTTSCSAVPPAYNFSTGNAITGIDSDVTEPIGNTNHIYRLICYGQGSTQAVDTVTVTTNGGVGARFCDEETFVARGNNLDICWELGTNDPAMCSITAGSAEILSPLPSANGTVSHLMVGEVTFDLECVGGDSDTMTVKVLPDLQET